jgi:hypothetical protein
MVVGTLKRSKRSNALWTDCPLSQFTLSVKPCAVAKLGAIKIRNPITTIALIILILTFMASSFFDDKSSSYLHKNGSQMVIMSGDRPPQYESPHWEYRIPLGGLVSASSVNSIS